MQSWPEFLATWLTVVGTVGATSLALYLALRDDLRRRRDRPKLQIGLRFTEPDCALVATQNESPSVAASAPLVPAYWFRAFVKNVGPSTATQIEVQIHELVRLHDGFRKPVPDFIASNLSWTHQPAALVHLPLLLPGTGKHFELGCIVRPAVPSAPDANAQAQFEFRLTVRPTYNYNRVAPGEYEFTVTVGASNAVPTSQRFALTTSGNWFNEPREMFRQGIRIEMAT